jgi:glycine/D-amino acid oxidase-like deaminating enzyme
LTGTVPYWLDEPYEPRPPLLGEVETDVCVIGAGTCGLSCALRLAQHGIDVAVLERGTVASGASGRNGGFLLAGVAPFHNDARESYGADRARAIYARTYAVQEDVYALALDLGVGDAVRRVGMLRVAVSEDEAEHVRQYARALAEDGFPARVVERDDLPPALRHGGLVACLTEHDGALHPARWYRALGGAAEAAGARIFENTTVQAPVEPPGEGPVLTDGGSVRAGRVVVAADGSLPALVPEYAGRVRPRRLHMVATEPVPPLVDTLVYSRWGYEYLQQRPDGRVLAGGFSDVDGADSYTDSDAGSPDIWERTRRYLADELGIEAGITHRWAGVVGYSADSLPYVGEVPGRDGLYVSGGYSGVGNVPGFMCGRDIADTIAGQPPEPLFPPGR